MTDIFLIEKSTHDMYDLVVYSTSGENVLNYLSDIEKELEKKVTECKNSKILFDMLLFSSNTPDRFIRADYCNNRFDESSFEIISVAKKDVVRKISLEFFISHRHFIEQSGILNSIQKKIILDGIPI